MECMERYMAINGPTDHGFETLESGLYYCMSVVWRLRVGKELTLNVLNPLCDPVTDIGKAEVSMVSLTKNPEYLEDSLLLDELRELLRDC